MKDRMSIEQLKKILELLFGAFLRVCVEFAKGRAPEWDVPCSTAQQILKSGDTGWFFGQFLQFLANGGRILGGLLEQTGKMPVAGATTFCAKDHIGTANIGHMNDRFRKLCSSLTEHDVPDTVLATHRLVESPYNYGVVAGPGELRITNLLGCHPQIIPELGRRAIIKLTHLLKLLEGQSKGQGEGLLIVDGNGNIAYIEDEGTTLVICMQWDCHLRHWEGYANPIGEFSEPIRLVDQIISCAA